MSLLGGITKLLIGSPGDQAVPPNMDFIRQLIAEDLKANRTNQVNPFTSWTWTQDPQTGRWTQTQSVNPAIQSGFDQFLQRFNAGPQGYSGAGELAPLYQSLLAQAMQGRPTTAQPPVYQRPQLGGPP